MSTQSFHQRSVDDDLAHKLTFLNSSVIRYHKRIRQLQNDILIAKMALDEKILLDEAVAPKLYDDYDELKSKLYEKLQDLDNLNWEIKAVVCLQEARVEKARQREEMAKERARAKEKKQRSRELARVGKSAVGNGNEGHRKEQKSLEPRSDTQDKW